MPYVTKRIWIPESSVDEKRWVQAVYRYSGKIDAIRLYRKLFDCSLRIASDEVTRLIHEENWECISTLD